jgi:hypothetical protein
MGNFTRLQHTVPHETGGGRFPAGEFSEAAESNRPVFYFADLEKS